MSFPKYNEYKDTGITWFQSIPAHWDICRFSHAISFQEGPGIMASDFLDEGIPLVRITGVKDRWVNLDGCNYLSPDQVQKKWNHFRLKEGDLLISASASMGTVSEVGKESVGAVPYTGLIRLTPKSDQSIKNYIRAIVISDLFAKQIDILKAGATIQHFGPTHLRQIRIPLAPISEQTAISNFLDTETAKIDALVAEQRRLIELLKEKRQAVISHAVTKGLNPDAPLKDSGIEWIGKTPTNWDIRKIRTISNVVRGASPRPAGDPKYFDGDFMPWVTVAEITKDNLKDLTGTVNYLTEEGSANSRIFEPNTLLYSNSGATLGVPKILKIQACANDGVIGFLDLVTGIDISYFYYFLYSLIDAIREKVKQGSGQPNLNTDIVKSLEIPVPPNSEQASIVAHIEDICKKYDLLEQEADNAINLLQERRTALISAAVTGKIDVREYTAQEPA